MAKYQDLGFSTFQIQIFFCHFWFPIKKNFCFAMQIYFCLIKNILRLIASIEKKIVTSGVGWFFRIKKNCKTLCITGSFLNSIVEMCISGNTFSNKLSKNLKIVFLLRRAEQNEHPQFFLPAGSTTRKKF